MRELELEENREKEGENSERLSTSSLVVISSFHLANTPTQHLIMTCLSRSVFGCLSSTVALSAFPFLSLYLKSLIQNDKTAHSSGFEL